MKQIYNKKMCVCVWYHDVCVGFSATDFEIGTQKLKMCMIFDFFITSQLFYFYYSPPVSLASLSIAEVIKSYAGDQK